MGIYTNSIFPAGGEAGNGGGIIQMKFNRKNDTYSESLSQGNASAVCLHVQMTCQTATSKVLVFYSVNMSCNNDNRNATVFDVDGSVVANATGDAYGTGNFRATSAAFNSSVSFMSHHTMCFVYEPNDTNQHTYGVRLKHGRNSTASVFLNRSSTMGNSNDKDTTGSFIVALEVSS